MKFKKNVTLKFKVTLLVLIILVSVCTMLTYTSIYKNKGNTNLAIQMLESSDIIENNTQNELRIEFNDDQKEVILEDENKNDQNTSIYSITNDTSIEVKEPITEITSYIKVNIEPVKTTLAVSQDNFKNMQIMFMVVAVSLGSIITYLILSKFLNPLTKMANIIENINHNNLDEEIVLPKSKDEIYKLSKSFNDMLLRIKKSFEMEKNFSASASHELKTPLSIMKSSIQVLKLSDNPTIEEYEENIEVIEENIEKLIDIVNSLLLLTSSDTGLFEKINIKDVTDKIILDYKNDLNSKNINIVNNIQGCNINSNKSLINCVFENIISNAIKYNKPYGRIDIDFKDEKDYIKFTIKDTGIGISKDNLQNIFNPFFREDISRSKDINGNGLGLSLVKNILEKINGNILIESENDLGTEVLLILKK
ncbi:MAG: HAMP domain-containing histidine kinase [Clostridiales bacterium]|nr:HAMP domain-containing histidine kinase [Clostridiales bacterium]